MGKEKSVKQTKAEPEALATSDQQDMHEDMTEQDLKPSYCNEDEPETVSELKPSESVIKRGVPKNTKLAPPVVAIKMADLLTPSDDGPKAETYEDPSHNVTNLNHQKDMEKQGQVEKLKSEKEHQETLKREEKAIAKKEQERLAKLWQEQKRKEKIKKEEDAKAKKEKEREEKRQKKEELKKQEHENLNKQEEQESKEQQCAEMKVKTELGKRIQEDGGHADEQEEDTTCRDSTEHDEDIPDNIMECGSKPSKSVIIRGVPKNTKPSPAVVAIKMADLLALPEDKDDSNNDETTFAENENQPKDGQLKLDKHLKLQEKIQREEEAKAKKEQESLAKLQKQEQQKLDKLKKEKEAKAKKEKELAEKREKREQQKLEKQRKEEESRAKKEEERKAKHEKQQNEKLQRQQAKTEIDTLKLHEQIPVHEEGQREFIHEDTNNDFSPHFEEDENQPIAQTESRPAESVIKRGVPKNTKPAPAVVAIKMSDLLAIPSDADA